MRNIIYVLLLLTVSCKPIAHVLFGFNYIERFEPEKNIAYMHKMGIDQQLIYVNAERLNEYQKVNGYNRLEFDRSMQPMQIRLYNERGNLIGYTVNCVAAVDEEKNLNWFELYDSDCALDSFGVEAKVGFLPHSTLEKEMQYWEAEKPILIDTSKQHVVVYFSRVIEKQNKNLINEVRERFSSCEDVEIIYVSMEDVIAKWFSGRLAYIPPKQDTTTIK